MNPGATLPRLLKHAQTTDSKYCAIYYCAHESPISDLLTRPCLCILSLQHAGSFTQVPQFIRHDFWKATRKCGTGQADQNPPRSCVPKRSEFSGELAGAGPALAARESRFHSPKSWSNVTAPGTSLSWRSHVIRYDQNEREVDTFVLSVVSILINNNQIIWNIYLDTWTY